MEATKFSYSTLPGQSITGTSLRSKRQRSLVIKSSAGESSGGGYGGRAVDENMIILRMRIKELKMIETKGGSPSDYWMEWEKKYFVNYDKDVGEAIGLLQNFLMNVRPSLGLGMVLLLAVCVLMSTGEVVFYAVPEVFKLILSAFCH